MVEAAERGRVEGEDVVFHKCAVAVFFIGVVELGKPLAKFGKVVRRQCAVHVFEQEVPSADFARGHGGEVGCGFRGGLPDGVDEACLRGPLPVHADVGGGVFRRELVGIVFVEMETDIVVHGRCLLGERGYCSGK